MQKPKALIVDIDGTLALNTGRGWYDYELVHTDDVDEVVYDILDRYAEDHDILIVTGRTDDCRDVTEAWFKENDIPVDQMFMREVGDERQDSVVKQQIFDTHIRGKYDVSFVLEDRNSVVDMWRKNKLKCLQVERAD